MLKNPEKLISIVEEAKKCILLCRNCHAELHYGDWDIGEIDVLKFDESKVPWHIFKSERSCKYCERKFRPKWKDHICCSSSCATKIHSHPNRKNFPSKEELQSLLWEMPMIKIAEIYGVSGKAVDKWAIKLECSKPPRGYWLKKEK